MTIRNLPQERSDEIAKKIASLTAPKPIDPKIVGDVDRYKAERRRYDAILKFWLEKKSESDDFAHTVDLALNPEKRKKEAKVYQRLHQNSDKMKALKAILKKNRATRHIWRG